MQSKFGLLLFFGLLLMFCGLNVSAQQSKECDTKGFRKPEFKIAFSSFGKTVLLDIVIKPKYQTDENLILLAAYLKQKYCMEKTIIATVFDNKKDARKFTVYQVRIIPDTLRAMYYLDRDTGKEKLVRVRVVDNKQVETPINLQN